MKTIFTKIQCATAVLALAVAAPAVHAQDQHAGMNHETDPVTDATTSGASTLLQIVRQATQQYQDVAVAKAAGYALNFGCVSGDDFGAMGLHYINSDLVSSGVLDPTRPQIIIYEPVAGGGVKLIGADFLVLADQWSATHSAPPQLMGQLFHYFPAPNRFGLPAFYTLHVWAWKENPKGAYVNWHSNVSCKPYTAQ